MSLLDLEAPPLEQPVRLPVVLRHVLIAMVTALTPRVGAPGWCADLVADLWRGDIVEARKTLRGFGVRAITPFGDVRTVHAIERALDAAFVVAEQHARGVLPTALPQVDALLVRTEWP